MGAAKEGAAVKSGCEPSREGVGLRGAVAGVELA